LDFVCERLGDDHDLEPFHSGVAELDGWLRGSARDSDGRNLTRTWVWHSGNRQVVGCYTLAPYFIERVVLSRRQGRGLPDRIPCYLLARLALGRSLHGQGLGAQMLASALLRVAAGAGDVGGRFVVVDALDDDAASFYRRHGFDDVPGVSGRLVLATKAMFSDALLSSSNAHHRGSPGS
jgi:GNAT superfamily N-acetyltransferase